MLRWPVVVRYYIVVISAIAKIHHGGGFVSRDYCHQPLGRSGSFSKYLNNDVQTA